MTKMRHVIITYVCQQCGTIGACTVLSEDNIHGDDPEDKRKKLRCIHSGERKTMTIASIEEVIES